MGRHNSSFEEKVQWFIAHPDCWRGWPFAGNTDDQIKDLMRQDGLISQKANNYDLADFGKVIAEARCRMRKGRHH